MRPSSPRTPCSSNELLTENNGTALDVAERELCDETKAKLRSVLGSADFERECASGRPLTVEDALALARDLEE